MGELAVDDDCRMNGFRQREGETARAVGDEPRASGRAVSVSIGASESRCRAVGAAGKVKPDEDDVPADVAGRPPPLNGFFHLVVEDDRSAVLFAFDGAAVPDPRSMEAGRQVPNAVAGRFVGPSCPLGRMSESCELARAIEALFNSSAGPAVGRNSPLRSALGEEALDDDAGGAARRA